MIWALLLACGWLAGTISGVAGFGGALVLLPVLAFMVGSKAAVPILTVAQLLGNASRAGFGWREIRWRPALLFSAGAVPASLIGARLFVALPSTILLRAIGVVLLILVALRHTKLGTKPTPARLLPPAGAAVGLLSALAGSAGPLGAAIFLSLRLPPQAYVATEAVTAALMHVTKSLTYGRYHAFTHESLIQGLILGSALVVGSWTGRKLLQSASEEKITRIVEMLLVVAAGLMIIGET